MREISNFCGGENAQEKGDRNENLLLFWLQLYVFFASVWGWTQLYHYFYPFNYTYLYIQWNMERMDGNKKIILMLFHGEGKSCALKRKESLFL